MKFAKWTHPSNGSTRIYVNGAAAFGISVFVVDGSTTGHYSEGFPEIIVRAKDGRLIGQSEIDRIVDAIDAEVQRLVPSEKAPTFGDYLSLAA